MDSAIIVAVISAISVVAAGLMQVVAKMNAETRRDRLLKEAEIVSKLSDGPERDEAEARICAELRSLHDEESLHTRDFAAAALGILFIVAGAALGVWAFSAGWWALLAVPASIFALAVGAYGTVDSLRKKDRRK